MDVHNGMMPLADIKRMAVVKRWQIVPTGRTQTMAEHSALVAMYALELLHRLVKPEWAGRLERAVLLWALVHDAPEIYTGDICSLSKEAISPEGLKGLEQLEQNTGPRYKALSEGQHYIVKGVVRGADLLEACVFLRQQWQGGWPNQHGMEVKKELELKYETALCQFIAELKNDGRCALSADVSMEFWPMAFLEEANR